MAYIRRHKYKTKVSFQVQIRRKGFRTIVKSFDTRTQAQKWARGIERKLDMGDLSVQLHDPIAPSGAQQVMEWIRTHYESVSGRAGYADFYKRDIQLKMLDPIGTVIELWDIKGAFITSANFGSLDYGNDEIMMIDLNLAFDNCVLQF